MRIEDTDKERSTDENMQEILEALEWLGLSADEKPVIQSEHAQDHLDAATKLLNENKAYRCFCSKEELDAEKAKAEAQKQPYRYSGRCRNLSKEEILDKLVRNIPFTVRFKVPKGVKHDLRIWFTAILRSIMKKLTILSSSVRMAHQFINCR